MKVGIMQPYFFPYIGYFALISYVDKWVVFDTAQYIERGWVNRNRIIHPTKPESTYITIPLEGHKQDTPIKDILIKSDELYLKRISGQLTSSYKKRAPYFKETMEVVMDCLTQETRNLSRLNVLCLKQICAYIGIPFEYSVFSEMDLDIPPVADAGEWALYISAAMGAEEYVNPIGGVSLFSPEKFKSKGIRLKFLQNVLPPYDQKKSAFIEGLSIIDVMMFNSLEEIRNMLTKNSFINASDAGM